MINYAVSAAPFLSDALTLLILVGTPIVISKINALAVVKGNTAVSNNLTKLAWDAAHFGIAAAPSIAARSVGGVYVSDPQVAAAANWLLAHADDEIKHLQLSPQSVVETVQAIIPQVKAALVPTLPATK